MENKDTIFSKKSYINCNGSLLDFDKPRIMGVLNVTPDSFYDGGYYYDQDSLTKRIEQLQEEGADIIDAGGYSSRPGADNISNKEEWKRLEPVLKKIRKDYPETIISVDTFRSDIAYAAVKEYSVDMINDISAGEMDEKMFGTISELQVPYIMMHMKGTPQNMKEKAHYDDMMDEILKYFARKYDQLRNMGVNDVILDPGFGFAKNIEQNFLLMNKLEQFNVFDLPLLVGISRKSMIFKTLNIKPQEALNGTTVLNTIALLHGADILRVHDVKEAKEVVQLVQKLQNPQ
ncbi:MAG: dihydropteroate synthase [Bacteroidota bacterium]